MSYYFRDRPRFSDRLRGSSGDDFMEALGRQLDQESKLFFEPTTGRTSRERDPFDRHTGFSRGFPFDDDDDFESRGNIRSHLDDLAARHPEFADQLLGPPWGDTPFLGTRRNRRRGSGLGSYHSHPDEDARSQASGSSAGSAASGASGVSSHGDPETHATSPQEAQDFGDQRQKERRRNPIPQYGLRNTVDIGQHRHNMENPDKMNRGQRSASAPPENRQQQQYYSPPQQQQQQPTQPQQQTQQQPPNPNQRFVSRVDITPQQQPPTSDNTKPPLSPKNQQQKPTPHQQSPPQHTQQQRPQQQPQSNVRHIPIFVEGRDEPVISRKVDDAPFPSTQHRPHSPPQFQTSSQFHRPSHFNQHFNNRQQQWPPQFHQPQYEQQGQQTQQPERPNHYQQQQQQYRQQQAENHRAQQQQQQQQQTQQQQQPEAEQPKLKQVQPKDPLEKVALVQKEVDSLMDQVKQFSGNSRQAKDYMYLDEMLTRELIKLDDIETEGKENVRQARKNAIKSIQNCIALLESKVPLPEQEQQMPLEDDEDKTLQQMETADLTTNVPGPETLESQNDAAPIPLPPAPSSPVVNSSSNPGEENPQVPSDPAAAWPDASMSSTGDASPRIPADETVPSNESTTETCVPPTGKSAEGDEPMATESAPLAKTSSVTAMEVQESEATAKPQPDLTESQPAQEAQDQKTEATDNVKPAKSKKKNQKTKLPKPVSEEPIPLPAPEVSESNVN